MNTVLENLTASKIRVKVVFCGNLSTDTTLGYIVRRFRTNIVPLYGPDAVTKLARVISILGVATVTLGKRSVFEIRAL